MGNVKKKKKLKFGSLTYKRYFEVFGHINPFPGEHHFVACYLAPLISKKLNDSIPKYVNPDGMKRVVTGDLVFSITRQRELCIEVKVNKGGSSSVKFSRVQVRRWQQMKDNIFILVALPTEVWMFPYARTLCFSRIKGKKIERLCGRNEPCLYHKCRPRGGSPYFSISTAQLLWPRNGRMTHLSRSETNIDSWIKKRLTKMVRN